MQHLHTARRQRVCRDPGSSDRGRRAPEGPHRPHRLRPAQVAPRGPATGGAAAGDVRAAGPERGSLCRPCATAAHPPTSHRQAGAGHVLRDAVVRQDAVRQHGREHETVLEQSLLDVAAGRRAVWKAPALALRRLRRRNCGAGGRGGPGRRRRDRRRRVAGRPRGRRLAACFAELEGPHEAEVGALHHVVLGPTRATEAAHARRRRAET
mmetsp:Transcript_33174/g.95492  ORF Transcript_33174/g.95492 Transcript_33174/m.95492 type:complete len:209 (+) Transcript_33174:346-972(+)